MEHGSTQNPPFCLPAAEDIRAMSDEQKKALAKELRVLWKALNTHPRSDWHRQGFEVILRIDMHPYGDKVQILTEQSLGEEPPRSDYVILAASETQKMAKAVYQFFRRFNIIEYKNPYDALNERVIRKIIGYANFYIGIASHADEIPADQVTISIFRAVKNRELFDKMTAAGELERTAEPGIYRVNGLTDLPFQIVITSELQGSDYAKFRVLVDHEQADMGDIRQVFEDGEGETDSSVQDYYRVFLNFVGQKNPAKFGTIKGVDQTMDDFLMELMRPRIEREKAEYAEKYAEKYVKDTTRKMAERMIGVDMPGDQISMLTDLNCSDIDAIAHKLNRTVTWNEARP